MATLQTLAQEMSNAFERAERTNGDKFVKLKEGSPKWMTDVCRAAHDNGNVLPDDTVYSMIEQCCDAIADLDEGADESEIYDRLFEIEADIYSHDLAAWLAASSNNRSYADEAIKHNTWSTLDDLLAAAQHAQIQEVGTWLVSALQEHLDELEDAA